jgi:hypothetical protein
LVLDARRISGLNDGDAVSTWNDVSGNGRDASNTLTARPLYKVGIQGGQPTVRFDGVNDYLVFSPSVTFGSPASAICVYKRSSTSVIAYPISGSNYSTGSFPIGEHSDNRLYIQGDAKYAASSATVGAAWRVAFASVSPGPVFGVWYNGITQPLGANVSAGATTGMTHIGARATNSSSADISEIIFIGENLALSLKRRLEHSAAFSFKIQCS